MTNLRGQQLIVFGSLFRDKYQDWPGDIFSLIDYCRKEAQRLSPKADPAQENAKI